MVAISSKSIVTECSTCSRKGLELFPVTAEDIQRVHGVDGLRVCGECLAKIRSWSRLESTYHSLDGLRDTVIFVPTILSILFLASVALSLLKGPGLQEVRLYSNYLGIVTILTGVLYAWNKLEPRYGLTHDLRWSVRSRRVVFALSIVFAGMILVAVSSTATS